MALVFHDTVSLTVYSKYLFYLFEYPAFRFVGSDTVNLALCDKYPNILSLDQNQFSVVFRLNSKLSWMFVLPYFVSDSVLFWLLSDSLQFPSVVYSVIR